MSAADSIQFLQFLIDNVGVLATIFILIILFPIVMVFLVWKLAMNLQKTTDKKIDSIDDTLNELSSSIKGIVNIVSILVFGKNDLNLLGYIRGTENDINNRGDDN